MALDRWPRKARRSRLFLYLRPQEPIILAIGFSVCSQELIDHTANHFRDLETDVAGVHGNSWEATCDGVFAEDHFTVCKRQLAIHKVSKLFKFRKDLPKNNVGKVLHKWLLEAHRIEHCSKQLKCFLKHTDYPSRKSKGSSWSRSKKKSVIKTVLKYHKELF